MKIQQATLEHLDELAPLFDAYRVFYKKESNLLAARKFLAERLLHNESLIFIAYTEGGEVAGFVQLYRTFSSVRLGRLWILNDLFVKPEVRGLGISKLLILKCQQLVATTGGAGLRLETATTNDIGNQLYPKMGFVLDRDDVNHYDWTNPEFVLEK